jgi:hypothetical protein
LSVAPTLLDGYELLGLGGVERRLVDDRHR